VIPAIVDAADHVFGALRQREGESALVLGAAQGFEQTAQLSAKQFFADIDRRFLGVGLDHARDFGALGMLGLAQRDGVSVRSAGTSLRDDRERKISFMAVTHPVEVVEPLSIEAVVAVSAAVQVQAQSLF